MQLDFKNESKVLVLYTGGTIGMRMLTIWKKIKVQKFLSIRYGEKL